MIKINYECDDCGKFNQYTLNKELLLICEKCNNKFGTINIDWNYNCNCLFCSKKKFL